MMSIGKHLSVRSVGVDPEAWTVHARNGTTLGECNWYAPWKQYVFEAEPAAIFSSDCLSDLARFIAEQTRTAKS
jgi:hypothetical protein